MDSPGESNNVPSQHTFSASPPAPGSNSAAGAGSVHKRTYQACLPCRRRKVRCDLGSVDEPGDPPCQRCRREKKDCVFSETRRKRKADDDNNDLPEDYVARNKRSSSSLTGNDGMGGLSAVANGIMLPGIADGAGNSITEGLPRPAPTLPKKPDKGSSNRDVTNETAAALFQGPIIQPADALHMLVDAASRSEIQERKGSHGSADRERLLAKQTHRLSTTGGRPDMLSSAIDPAIMALEEVQRTAAEAHVQAALNAWSRLRFVQAGWFTAREAISYIDYFYEHLAPLTPISPPDFSNYAEHPRLLEEEPMLTVTLLTITSRYKRLEGPGGNTRSFKIHDKLWEYLQGMVTRMFWGQEQFGGGFCGAGNSRPQPSIDTKRRGLRALGTAESLLLLSDWLPRAMHFPPGDDGNELLVPLISNMTTEDIDIAPSLSNIHAAWTEPAIRSDRMCWSLIGMAYTLSWEIGVFDSLLEEKVWTPGFGRKDDTDYTAEDERADRIGRMLLVYVSQACGRLGFPNMMPSQGKETNFDFLKMDIPQGSHPNPFNSGITETDRIQRAWAELTALMRQSNTEMFESKKKVHEVIKDKSYIEFLKEWGPRMKEWKEKFDQTEMPPKAKIILQMEFEYTKTYINSMALQAVMESAAGQEDSGNTEPNSNTAHTPPALFSSKVVEIHKENRVYIEELIESSRNVLRLAIEGLRPTGALRHSPVRTHFRMLSGAMFLLKSFAVGGKESEVSISLNLLEDAIIALRKSVIDDVHLSLRIADLLDGLTTKIRKKFVRLAIPSRGNKQRSGHTQRPSTSNPTSAPKPSIQDRRASGNAAGRHHHSNSMSSQAGQNGNSNSNANLNHAQDDYYSLLGLEGAPPLVNLKDHNITIMPPPDLNFANSDYNNASGIGAPLSPHTSGAPSGALNSPPIGSMTRPRNSSFDAPGSLPFSPSQASFSPMSTGSGGATSGGYDWLALDFNPIIANGAHFGLVDHNQGVHDHGHNHNHHNNSTTAIHDSNGNGNLGDGDEAQGGVGASPWTMGAFGPEISEGLEMLGALGALVWEDQGQGQTGHGSGQQQQQPQQPW